MSLCPSRPGRLGLRRRSSLVPLPARHPRPERLEGDPRTLRGPPAVPPNSTSFVQGNPWNWRARRPGPRPGRTRLLRRQGPGGRPPAPPRPDPEATTTKAETGRLGPGPSSGVACGSDPTRRPPLRSRRPEPLSTPGAPAGRAGSRARGARRVRKERASTVAEAVRRLAGEQGRGARRVAAAATGSLWGLGARRCRWRSGLGAERVRSRTRLEALTARTRASRRAPARPPPRTRPPPRPRGSRRLTRARKPPPRGARVGREQGRRSARGGGARRLRPQRRREHGAWRRARPRPPLRRHCGGRPSQARGTDRRARERVATALWLRAGFA